MVVGAGDQLFDAGIQPRHIAATGQNTDCFFCGHDGSPVSGEQEIFVGPAPDILV
jgi:hypothetical protein